MEYRVATDAAGTLEQRAQVQRLDRTNKIVGWVIVWTMIALGVGIAVWGSTVFTPPWIGLLLGLLCALPALAPLLMRKSQDRSEAWSTGESMPPEAMVMNRQGITFYREEQEPVSLPWGSFRLSVGPLAIPFGRRYGQFLVVKPEQQPGFSYPVATLVQPLADIEGAVSELSNGTAQVEHS